MKLSGLPRGSCVVVSISADGRVEMHVEGIKGPRCEGLLDNLSDLFGEIVEDGRTSDYTVPATAAVGVGG